MRKSIADFHEAGIGVVEGGVAVGDGGRAVHVEGLAIGSATVEVAAADGAIGVALHALGGDIYLAARYHNIQFAAGEHEGLRHVDALASSPNDLMLRVLPVIFML